MKIISIFLISFGIAFTGAAAPGPLLTYTIIQTLQNEKKGFLTGAIIILGHAVLELIVLFALLLGLSFVLKSPLVLNMITLMGCGILLFFGIGLLIDLKKNKISVSFITENNDSGAKIDEQKKAQLSGSGKKAFWGGIFVSMSNPYWWIWWASVGSALWVNLNISLDQPAGIIAFFVGHEMGDLIWYSFISVMVFFGRKILNKKIYYGLLFVCALLMIFFGVFMALNYFKIFSFELF